MSPDNTYCAEPRTRGVVRAWSEDPLTARARSVWTLTDLFDTCYGPTVATLRASDPDSASQLRHELTRLFQQSNIATDGITRVVGEYLEVHARVA